MLGILSARMNHDGNTATASTPCHRVHEQTRISDLKHSRDKTKIYWMRKMVSRQIPRNPASMLAFRLSLIDAIVERESGTYLDKHQTLP